MSTAEQWAGAQRVAELVGKVSVVHEGHTEAWRSKTAKRAEGFKCQRRIQGDNCEVVCEAPRGTVANHNAWL